MCAVKAAKWDWMQAELDRLQEEHLVRQLVATKLQVGGWLERDGRRMLNLASNDYLGLASESGIRIEPSDVQYPCGAGASRLVAGNDPIYTQLEQEFAAFKGTECCLLFSSGYMANLGIIPALVGRHDYVFSDRLNHASIVDGIQLSRAEHVRYRHRDLNQLEHQLKKAPANSRKLIVTDTIFSMDGTIAPLQDLVTLKDRYGAMLMVDEAHSGGVYGSEGQGIVHAMGLQDQVEVQMGTFSKAYGAVGAYVAGDAVLIQYLINRARTLIYNTALPPILIYAIRENWLRSQREAWRRQALQSRAQQFRSVLQAAGFDMGDSESQIVPLMIGDNVQAIVYSRALQAEGIAAVAIRPPTVPQGSARIRFTIMATHQEHELNWAAQRMIAIGQQMRLI
ncbi:8-amino-7-oxononanoate synthase [Paenibacillus guangzhouensis]|uniref:8-amino-7-oxononanoate synthase n=1 Tax=Paenibacillus guangzhouensis TaxID=1473112 RepID=UPI001D12ABE4|nr:8-amino-7-oxononanoate synthase [Paenibacillus guangzhouensis]